MNLLFHDFALGCAASRRSEDRNPKKVRYTIATEVVRQGIFRWLAEHNRCADVATDAYVAGSPYKCSILVVEKDAKPAANQYLPEDVLAIIRVRSNGLFRPGEETDGIARSINRVLALNPAIRWGYITMTERVPVKAFHADGRKTLDYWRLTQDLLHEKIAQPGVILSSTLEKGTRLYDSGSDDEFEQFLNILLA